MRTIAVDPTEGFAYEGENDRGREIVPTPTFFVATNLTTESHLDSIPKDDDLGVARLLFREDSSDVITRVRRGRFYVSAGDTQPRQWYVTVRPGALGQVSPGFSGHYAKLLHGFVAWPARNDLRLGSQPSLIALGIQSAYSLWRVVDIERTVTGEDLVTLRARSSLGLLPELRESAVPLDALPKVKEALETLVHAAHTSAPSSVIDRARDVALSCIGAWMSEEKEDRSFRTKELADLAKTAQLDKHDIVASVARSIARLHASAKPNEQERHSARPPMESDAEYVLAAVGLLLRDIGWAL